MNMDLFLLTSVVVGSLLLVSAFFLLIYLRKRDEAKKRFCTWCTKVKTENVVNSIPMCEECEREQILKNLPPYHCPECKELMTAQFNISNHLIWLCKCKKGPHILLGPEAAKDYLEFCGNEEEEAVLEPAT